MLKDAYLSVYQSISPAPILDADVVDWAEEAILDLIKEGVIDPAGPTLYEPLTPITRGDFIHFLVKALDLESKTGRVITTFTDVDPNLYYYFTIGSGQAAGLVEGGGDICMPKRDITQQELITLIYRALLYAGVIQNTDPTALETFNDADQIDDYAVDAFAALINNGLLEGDNNKKVNPLAPANRAYAAVLLYRVYNHNQAGN